MSIESDNLFIAFNYKNLHILIACVTFLSEEMKTLLNPEYLEHDA